VRSANFEGECERAQARAPASARETRRKRINGAHQLPDGFAISDRVKRWARERGFGRLEERLEHFIGYAKRSGKRYADWDAAFESAIREDWAKLGHEAKGGRSPMDVGEVL
jgi:hypothetical protein